MNKYTKSLDRAIRAGNVTSVVSLLEGANAPYAPDRDYDLTPLAYAARNGNELIVSKLIDLGFDFNQADEFDGTPLFSAVRGKSLAVCKILLDAGADVNFATSPDGQEDPHTPLSLAAKINAIDLVKLLHMRGAKANWIHDQDLGPSVLTYARKPEVVKYLLEAGANPDTPNWRPAIIGAAYDGLWNLVELMIEYRANPNIKCPELGYSLLALSIENAPQKVIKKLIEAGARFNTTEDLTGIELSDKTLKILKSHGIQHTAFSQY